MKSPIFRMKSPIIPHFTAFYQQNIEYLWQMEVKHIHLY